MKRTFTITMQTTEQSDQLPTKQQMQEVIADSFPFNDVLVREVQESGPTFVQNKNVS